MDNAKNLWESVLQRVKANRLPLSIVALLLFTPIVYFSMTDPLFSVWISPVSNSIIPTDELRIDVQPESPVVEGTTVEITVTNLTNYLQSNATVFVIEGNGTILYFLTTGQSGLVSFEYPGHPVIVYAEVNDAESRKLIVGDVPFAWYIALSLAIPSCIIFLLFAVIATRKSQHLDKRIQELEDGFRKQREKILSVKSISDLRQEAIRNLENVQSRIHGLPQSLDSHQVSREIIVFLGSHGLEEHLVIGLALIPSEVTGDKRLDRKFAIIALVQTFENLLILLGKMSDNDDIREEFVTSSRLILSYMLTLLFQKDSNVRDTIKTYSSFDRSLGNQDFESKLNSLLMISQSPNPEIAQPALDFSITTLIRNYTHHSSELDSEVFSNPALFEKAVIHILGALIRAFIILHPLQMKSDA